MTEQELNNLIQGWKTNDHKSTQVLMGVAYNKIKELSVKHRGKSPENANTALLSQSATDLAHDVYIKLVKTEPTISIETQREFYSYLNAAVRNTFIDHYRKLVETQSRNPERTSLTSFNAVSQTDNSLEQSSELTSLAIQIENLSNDFPRQAESIELRYFAQRTNKEIARLQNVSLRTVENDLRFAKAWIRQKL